MATADRSDVSRAGWMSAIAAIAAALGSVIAWQREPPPTSAATVSLDGAELFQAKGCAACHAGPDSTASLGSQFPSLAGASSWAGDRRPNLTASAYLSESIREPWAFVSPEFSPGGGGPTAAMPALELSDAEVDAIVEYLLAG